MKRTLLDKSLEKSSAMSAAFLAAQQQIEFNATMPSIPSMANISVIPKAQSIGAYSMTSFASENTGTFPFSSFKPDGYHFAANGYGLLGGYRNGNKRGNINEIIGGNMDSFNGKQGPERSTGLFPVQSNDTFPFARNAIGYNFQMNNVVNFNNYANFNNLNNNPSKPVFLQSTTTNATEHTPMKNANNDKNESGVDEMTGNSIEKPLNAPSETIQPFAYSTRSFPNAYTYSSYNCHDIRLPNSTPYKNFLRPNVEYPSQFASNHIPLPSEPQHPWTAQILSPAHNSGLMSTSNTPSSVIDGFRSGSYFTSAQTTQPL